jgi:hypothetical protein
LSFFLIYPNYDKVKVAEGEDDDGENDENDLQAWDSRYDYEYREYKAKLDGLLRSKIPRQYQHLNFKEMRLVTQVNLKSTLNDIDSKYLLKDE